MSGFASSSSSEVSARRDSRAGRIEQGSHIAYIFSSSSEKQAKLFQLCEMALRSENSFVFYLAGKQGVKGIRLSLKDTGFDISLYERARQLKIVDSDEWFLLSGKQKSFRSNDELQNQLTEVISEASGAGYSFVTVISETDSLVRKGFYSSYRDFDEYLGRKISNLKVAFVCAFDERELQAAGVSNAAEEIAKMHSELI